LRREEQAGAVFGALADPTRRNVLSIVGDHGPLTATEVAARLPVTRQAVAKHLDALRTAGLVTSAKSGRDVRFVLRTEALGDAARWMAAVGDRWDRRLERLHDRAENLGKRSPRQG
jgi:DNA-binding transcriptional ArsR family regulator